MDKFNELTTGAKLVLGTAVALFIVSWFSWFEVNGVGVDNMWGGLGILAGLFLIALIVWQGVRLANIDLEIGVTPSMVTAALAILTLLFTFIRFIDKPGSGLVSDAVDRTFWAWLGLILAIVIVVGAWMNMQASGESLADIRSSVAGAATAARGAVDRKDEPSTSPASSPPASPAPPAEDALPDDEAPRPS